MPGAERSVRLPGRLLFSSSLFVILCIASFVIYDHA